MAAPDAIIGATTEAFELFDRVELYVNRYVARRDLVVDNVELLQRLLEEHDVALQLVESNEQQHALDRIFLCNQVISRRLGVFKSALENNKTRLDSLSDDVRKAGAMNRVRRANAILKECKVDVKDFHSFVSKTVLPSLKEEAPNDRNVSESYVPDRNAPLNPPRLTLGYTTAETCEGRLKAAILEEYGSGIVGVVACGLGGVGKTCALRGLARDEDVKRRFPDGVLYISLGNHSQISDIIHGIARAVERTGGHQLARTVRGTRTVQDASDKTARWFRSRMCLFLVDDIWWVNGITSKVFRDLRTMLHERSLLVYTTRDERFLKGADKRVVFGAREPYGTAAQDMLMNHAGFNVGTKLSAPNSESFKGILEICNGLPLALGIAGATVMEYCENLDQNKQDAWSIFFRKLQTKEKNIIDGDAEEYGPLVLMVDRSLEVLDSKADVTKALPKTFVEMFRGFCVLKKQQKVSGQVLQKLWSLGEIGETEEIAKEFQRVSLVQISRVEDTFFVGLHDLVFDIAMQKALEEDEVSSWFEALADNYITRVQPPSRLQTCVSAVKAFGRKCICSRAEDASGAAATRFGMEQKGLFRSWWDIEDDGFIHDNVCRLLQGAGEWKEVLWLLERAQWVIPRLQKGGINALEEDLRIAQEVARRYSSEQQDVLRYLDMVRSAARMSCNAVMMNRYEAWFQIFGRVAWFAKQCKRTSGLVLGIEQHAPRPWVQPPFGFLHEAGGAALDSTFTGVWTLCISHGEHVIMFVHTDYGRYVVSAVEYDSRYGTQVRHALVLRHRHGDAVSGGPSHGSDEGVEEKVQCFCAAFSSDRSKVVTGYADGSVAVWDVESGYKLDRRLRGFCDSVAVKCIAWSRDGSKMFCGTSEGAVHLLSYGSDGDVRSATAAVEHGKQVVCLAASWDERRIVWALDDESVGMWDSNRGEAVKVAAEVEAFSVLFVAVSADGGRVVCGTEQDVVVVWDVGHTETSVRTLAGHSGQVRCVAISSDGRVAASGSSDCSVRLWNTENGEMIGQALVGHMGFVTSVALSADCTKIVSASVDRALRVWDVQRNSDMPRDGERFESEIMSFAYAGNGARAVFGSRDGSVRWLDVESGEMVGEPLRGHRGAVNVVALSGDGRRVVSASFDGTVRVWDANSGDAVGAPIAGPVVYSVAVSNDGTHAFAGCADGTVRVCDTESGGVSAVLAGHTDAVRSVALSSGGTRLASGSNDKSVRMWDVRTCAPVAPPLERHADFVYCVAWSADAKRVLSASGDGTVRVWDVHTAQQIGAPLRHDASVVYVQSDAHCSRLVSYDFFGYGRLWDVASGQCITTSSHREWSQTLHRLALSSLRVELWWLRDMEIVARNADGGEQVLATTDRPFARVGDKYFAAVHGPSSVPFCEIHYPHTALAHCIRVIR